MLLRPGHRVWLPAGSMVEATSFARTACLLDGRRDFGYGNHFQIVPGIILGVKVWTNVFEAVACSVFLPFSEGDRLCMHKAMQRQPLISQARPTGPGGGLIVYVTNSSMRDRAVKGVWDLVGVY
jgi:hypothetical protein